MSATQNINKTNTYKVKAIVTTLERHNPQTLKRQKENTEYKVAPSAVHITIQTIQDKIRTKKKKSKCKSIPDTSCVKDTYGPSKDIEDKSEKQRNRRKKTYRLIFPEMRGGILYSRCYCLHRNGLQDNCPLTQCQGRPECLVKPWAVCPPAKLIKLRHPELFPKASICST